MQRRSHRSHPCVARLLATLVAFLLAAFALAGGALAAGRVQPGGAISSASAARTEATKVRRYWTPARMRSARPLDLTVAGGGRTRLKPGPPAEPAASASFLAVPTPSVPPYSVNGRIFFLRGGEGFFCSGTAINSPTRQLVLTAGHCVASGPDEGHRNVWSHYMEFVPAYSGGVAPFGAFIGRRTTFTALPQWTRYGNPDFDMGAFLTRPNAEGVNVADAVGGGATIVTDLSRHQSFQTFGYPGETKHMQGCRSRYIGDDLLSTPLPGPPTMAIGCRWSPGSSGGGWLIAEDTEIDGITTYGHPGGGNRTFGPYFSSNSVGRLVRGY
jgi:V8-like Glu-specific endopeptidase